MFKINVILLLMAVGWGCKKDVTTTLEEFSELKAFYNKYLPNANSFFKNTSPMWGNVNKLEYSDFWVYEVTVSNPNKIGITSKQLTVQDIAHYENTHALRLLLFVNPQTQTVVKGCYMAIEVNNSADLEKVHYKKINGLNGQVVYYNLDGTFSNGVVYVAGKPMYKIQNLPAQEMLELKKQGNSILQKNASMTVQGCSTYYIEMGYVGCVYDFCHWYSTGGAYFTTCGGGYDLEASMDDIYGGGGGGDGNIGNGGGGGSGAYSAEDPSDTYEVETLADSINLKSKLDCFKGVPNNANTTYTAKICADLPDDSNPLALIGPDRVGHAFIILTKTNGSNTITQTFGFYPQKGIKSISGLYVNSQIEDDGATQHQYNASYTVNLNQLDFERVMNSAKTYSALKYNLNSFNCTDYALAVFNAGLDNNNQISVPDWIPSTYNYGTTPTGLYKKIKEMKDAGKSGAATTTGNAPSSSNCN